ncbi:ester cyclase [Streptomyces antimicrobicus]|uniref:Ester cyclase n=1 Tax=Streptomyces antimicrobicus TaxID=2883108 RepID=A0ABS8B8P2_9ACTN|nr:ester cyclase [Streptomyces antimicrobicus]MCB5180977.1 ester cyclase [Streptomyces antimicrobicus]
MTSMTAQSPTSVLPPAPATSDAAALAEYRKKKIALLFEQIITHGDLDLADELFHEDFRWPQFGLHGPEGVRTWVRAFRTAFPDMVDTVVEQWAEGDTVITRVECTATQLGPFRGLPPSGRKATFGALGIDRFRGDKVIERSAHFDLADLMRKYGHTHLHVPEVDRP